MQGSNVIYRPWAMGQIPGQSYTAQVVDENGKGLQAAFFLVDLSGTPITQPFPTDPDGKFHFTYPDDNADQIFVNIYADSSYQPIVKTFDELVNSPLVILVGAKGSKALLPLLLIGSAGVVLLATTGSGKVTGLRSTYGKAKAKYKGLSPGTKKVIVYGAVGIGGFFLIKYLLSYKPTEQQKKQLADAGNMLQLLAAEYGIVPSLPLAEYSTMANELQAAAAGCGTETGTILRVFGTLNNEADIYELIVKCDILTYKSCFETLRANVHFTLPEMIVNELDGMEIIEVNSILQGKGIKFQF